MCANILYTGCCCSALMLTSDAGSASALPSRQCRRWSPSVSHTATVPVPERPSSLSSSPVAPTPAPTESRSRRPRQRAAAARVTSPVYTFALCHGGWTPAHDARWLHCARNQGASRRSVRASSDSVWQPPSSTES